MNKKIVLLIIFILAIILVHASGFTKYFTLENIQTKKNILEVFVNQHYFISVISFILAYILIVTFQIPAATVLTLAGGALFGTWFGLIWVNLGAATGALIAFLFARYLFQDIINNKFESKLKKFNQGVIENGFSYILFLRLVPIFPFFLINLLAGVTKIKTKDYYFATVIGIIPGSFVYCNLGSALWQLHSTKDIIAIKNLIALSLLGVLSLIPLLYKKYRGKKYAI